MASKLSLPLYLINSYLDNITGNIQTFLTCLYTIMKNLISIIVIAITLVSCSTTNTFTKGTFQKRKYNKGIYINIKSNITASNKQKEVKPLTILNETKEKIFIEDENHNDTDNTVLFNPSIINKADSVLVILKNGDTYKGIIIDEDETGHQIQQEDGRVVYLAKKDIEEIISLKRNETTQLEVEIETAVKVEELKEHYSQTTPIKTSSNDREQSRRLQAPPSSKASAVIFFVTLFILIVPTIPAILSLFSFILGLILSIVGFNKAKRQPSTYHLKKAKGIKWLYLAPISILLSLIGLALTMY